MKRPLPPTPCRASTNGSRAARRRAGGTWTQADRAWPPLVSVSEPCRRGPGQAAAASEPRRVRTVRMIGAQHQGQHGHSAAAASRPGGDRRPRPGSGTPPHGGG